ncbi:hypothetical protein [Reichenbachiella sp.]|uniref:hypothetical protein n=1 Tax=Reichenbachiella sp. TaxID=2184521 RepID=UPI003BB13BC1
MTGGTNLHSSEYRQIVINGQTIQPPELEDSVLDIESYAGSTLVDWLHCLYPSIIESAATHEQVVKALNKFKVAHGLIDVEPSINQNVWSELQLTLEKKNNLSRVEQFKVNFETEDENALEANLKAFGILAQGTEQIKSGMRLLEALMRQTDQYDKSIDGDVIHNYQELHDYAFNYADSVWKTFHNHWQLFLGAPWLGITKSPDISNTSDAFWCSKELLSILYRLGEVYFKKLVEKKSQSYALENPIVVLYLGNRLGGVVFKKNDFSQIGRQAALDLTGLSDKSLEWLNECLMKTDPAWRIRLQGDKPNLSHIIYVKKPMSSAILEMKPELQYVLSKPQRIYSHLKKHEDFFSEFPLERFAQAVSDRAYTMSSDELSLVFKTIKNLGVQTLMEFIGALRDSRGLGEVLYRIHTEGNDIIQDILQLHYESLGLDTDGIKAKVVEWEAYLVRFFIIESGLKGGNDLLKAAWEILKEEAVEQVQKKLQPEGA